MKLQRPLRIRFGDIDEAGLVYYPRFLHYYHQLFEDFFYDYLQRPYHHVVQKERYGLPCIQIEASFKKPLKYGANSRIQLEIETLGKTSICWRYQIFLLEDATPETPELAAEAKITTVGVQMDHFRATEIPHDLRKALEDFYQGEGIIEI